MLRSLFLFLRNLLGESVARILTGGGLALASFAGLSALWLAALDMVRSYAVGVAGDMLAVILLFGFGEALTLIGTAVMTRAGLQAATLGITRSRGAPR